MDFHIQPNKDPAFQILRLTHFSVLSNIIVNNPGQIYCNHWIHSLSLQCSRTNIFLHRDHCLLNYPCRCLCFGFSQITLILPFLLMILHFSQIGFTDDLTFIVKILLSHLSFSRHQRLSGFWKLQMPGKQGISCCCLFRNIKKVHKNRHNNPLETIRQTV